MKKAIAVLIAASMLITPAYAATQEAIDYVQSEGIIEGDENGSLNLKDNVTRAEAAKGRAGCTARTVRRPEATAPRCSFCRALPEFPARSLRCTAARTKSPTPRR